MLMEARFDNDEALNDLIHFRNVAIDYKEGRFLAEWLENINFYLGNQYSKEFLDSIAGWRSTSVNNVIYQTVEQVHSLLTDDQTMAFVRRTAEGSYQVERILDNIIKQVWDKREVQAQISKMEKDRLFFGTGFLKVFHNKFIKSLLDIDVKRISPFDFYVDPLATDICDARYVFERERTSKSELMNRYPDMVDLILNSEGDSGNPRGDEGSKARSSEDTIDTVYIWHCYITDLTLIEEADSDIVTEADIKQSKRKFPNGRYVVMMGDELLSDEKWDFKEFPFVRVPLIEVPDEFFGQSLVTPMKAPQEELNILLSLILDNTKSSVNPIFVATEGVIDIDEFVPIPNSVVTLRNKNEDSFDRLPGTQLPSEVFAMLSQKKDEIFQSAGVSDVTFGTGAQSSRPGTVRANFNASITRIREYLRASHRAIENVGKKILEIAQKKTSMNTAVSLSNRDDAPIDFGDSKIIEDVLEGFNDPRITKNLEVVNVILNEQNPEFQQQVQQIIASGGIEQVIGEKEAKEMVLRKGVAEFKNDIKKGEYEYIVASHPITVNDPDKMLELMQVLLQYGNADPSTGSPGVIDFQFVLDNINLPNKSDLIKRLNKKQKFLEQNIQQQNKQQPQQPQQQGA